VQTKSRAQGEAEDGPSEVDAGVVARQHQAPVPAARPSPQGAMDGERRRHRTIEAGAHAEPCALRMALRVGDGTARGALTRAPTSPGRKRSAADAAAQGERWIVLHGDALAGVSPPRGAVMIEPDPPGADSVATHVRLLAHRARARHAGVLEAALLVEAVRQPCAARSLAAVPDRVRVVRSIGPADGFHHAGTNSCDSSSAGPMARPGARNGSAERDTASPRRSSSSHASTG
jgi:hypothetical protein